MVSKIASFLSYLFHPIFLTIIGILIIFNTSQYITIIPQGYKKFIYSIILLSTVIIPLAILPVMYLYKSIQSISMSERRERIVPLFFTALCFYLGYYLVSKYTSIRIIDIFLLSCFTVLVVLLVISLFWKISLHMAGLGGITGLIFMISLIYSLDMTFYLSLSLIISGIVASARLTLRVHNHVQIAAGFFTGLLIVCLFMSLLLPWSNNL